MLSLNNISFEFGSRYLYKDATWQINPGEKIGLIGANGTGKSTLLRIINGEYSLESGNIAKIRDLTIGFLNQDLLSYDSNDSILAVSMQAFGKQNSLHEEIEEILRKLEHDHSDELLHALHDKQTAYEAMDGYNLQHRAESLLEGLGFSTEDLHRPLCEFSGGWRMRVMLAKIMLQKPDLLLLDEPTNHLDLPSIQWIENYLANYQGTIVIVSHDRYFLDKIVNKIAEIANEKITIYSGNYTFYEQEKALREELQRSQFKNQEKYIKEQEKLIDRFRAKASKAKMAQSRIKALDKMERISDVESANSEIRINFQIGQQPGKVISKLKIDRKEYPKLRIFEHTEATIERGDKIAFIGANGKGKSTLLRMIAGVEPFDGQRAMGHNVVESFYAQHQLESLNLNHEILEELQYAAPDQSDQSLRAILGAFLFGGDDAFKKIKVLSGGEKSRVALAKVMLSKSNFLILDEPTNHLDIQSVRILIDVLNKYEGTFIVVSHDRFFLSQIANKIWYIENKEVKEYPGKYDEYEEYKLKASSPPPVQKKVKPGQVAETNEHKNKHKDDEQHKQQQKLAKRFKGIEEKLASLELKKKGLERQLALPDIYQNPEKFQAMLKQFNESETQLKDTTKEWEDVFEQVSKLEGTLKSK